jgi:hypothetical protein
MVTSFNETPDAVTENPFLSDRRFKLPLISLVIANYNYAAYVGRAINSVRHQHYLSFECIIVDNASTDDSLAVINGAVAGDQRFTVVRLEENIGQLRAVLHVFDRLRGSFVVVVDADDVLMPEFLSSHVQVHLALPASVSLSSSDVIEIDADDRVLGGGWVGFAADCESEPRGLRATETALRLTAISEADYERLSDATITAPHWKSQWIWAPGTANMYRKSALDLTLPEVSRLRSNVGFEGHFCPILHLITGSALICRRLSAYRIHGRNTFSRAPSMKGVGHPQRKRPNEQELAVLRSILSRAEAFNAILAGDRFWPTIDLLCGIYGLTPHAYFARTEVQGVVADNFHSLIEMRGARALIAELSERLDFRCVSRLMRAAYKGSVPLSLRWALIEERTRRVRRSMSAERGHRLLQAWRNTTVKPTPSGQTSELSKQAGVPAIFIPGLGSNERVMARGIWADGWADARCELVLAGGEQSLISMEGMVPHIAPGFRSALVVRVDEQQVGALDLEPGDIHASWPIPPADHPRAITLEFSRVQALARPDIRKAAMLIREIAVRPCAAFDNHRMEGSPTAETQASGRDEA